MSLSRPELAAVTAARQAAGEVGVFTNGCFDLLHVGHLRTLQAARELGDFLIVGLNSDAGVRRLKGAGRPIVPAGERAELLLALRCVDYVGLFDEPTALEMVAEVQPRIYVKSVEYAVQALPEREVVEGYGGEVRLVEIHAGRSTTDLVGRILAAHAER
ncbi:MAG: adenylyltransferase/cytidyltransferase family protein [Armatimonadetes bacterium]|nr:adenylyltransferase/cytidyltransferase family protein [Armatimonadota bacterium]